MTFNKADVFIEKAPQSIINTEPHVVPATYSDLNGLLTHWAGIIKKYDSIESVLDDPILKAYQAEFFAEYKIIDDDADYAPFKSQQLFFLDEYLGIIEENLEKHKDGSNNTSIDEIKADTQTLRQQLTSLPKNKVMQKLTTIWAKMQKQGLKLIKEFVKEGKKEFFKFIIKKLIDGAAGADTTLLE
jgi:hypothetical protein